MPGFQLLQGLSSYFHWLYHSSSFFGLPLSLPFGILPSIINLSSLLNKKKSTFIKEKKMWMNANKPESYSDICSVATEFTWSDTWQCSEGAFSQETNVRTSTSRFHSVVKSISTQSTFPPLLVGEYICEMDWGKNGSVFIVKKKILTSYKHCLLQWASSSVISSCLCGSCLIIQHSLH